MSFQNSKEEKVVLVHQALVLKHDEHKKKKIQFTDTDIRHAQQRIRLDGEKLAQADFLEHA